MGLEALSDDDLMALKAGKLDAVSDKGLMSLKDFQAVKAEGRVKSAPLKFTPSGEKPGQSWDEPGMILAHPSVRAARGITGVDAGLGLVQLAANAVGQGEGINKTIAELDRQTNESRAALGDKGTDWWNIGGNAASLPMLGAAKALPETATAAGRIVQGAGFGAAAGALTPVTDAEDYWSTKGSQTAHGAVVGALLPAGWEAAKAAGRTARNVAQPYIGEWGADRAAGRLANEAAGDKAEAVIQALLDAKQHVPGSNPTAGQAASGAGSAEFSALQKAAADRAPSVYYGPKGVEGEQNAARVAAVQSVGKDKAALEAAKLARSENAAENYGPIMEQRVSPKSQADIMAEAVENRAASKAEALRDQGRFATTEAQMGERGNNAVPVPGMPRVPARVTDFPERAAEAKGAAADASTIAKTRRDEQAFLEQTTETLKNTVGLENKSLYDFLSRPSMQAALKDAAKGAQERNGYFPQKKGDSFSVANLQRMKESLDDIVKDPASFGIKATEAREIESTRKAFVNWLSEKVPAWRDARLQYSSDSVPINQMQIGQELEKRLVPALSEEAAPRATAYANALRDAPQTVKRATGQPRYDELGEVMTPKQMEKLTGVQSDLARAAVTDELARKGASATNRLVGTAVPEIGPTGMFSPKISVTRALYNRLTGHATDKILDDLATRMKDPVAMAKLMQDAKPFERKAIVDELMRLQAVAAQGSQREGN
jgi:hypothetical protein